MVLEEAGRPLKMADLPVSDPGQGQMLVGVRACGGIHMSDIPSSPYALLWGERTVKSAADLTRQDGERFLRLATEVPVTP